MKNNNFKIVLTTRNASKYIEQSLLSLKNQRYSNWECVVIDDCSEDGSQDLIKKAANNDPRFKLVFNSERKYGLKNRVEGTRLICNSDEDIVVVMDGDDWLSSNDVLEYLNHTYQNDSVWITYGQHHYATDGLGTCKYDDICFTRYNFLNRSVSHLRSYKYWLFKKIKEEDFKDENGKYFIAAEDIVALFPMCEMAGNHLKFLPRVSYIYNNLSELNEYKICAPEQFHTLQVLLKKPCYPLIEKNEPFRKLNPKIYDKEFVHCKYSGTDVNGSEYIEWYRGNEERELVFYTNRCLDKINNKEKGLKIAWLLEPEVIAPESYNYIRKYHDKFDYVLTHNKSILDTIPNSFFVPAAQTWIRRNEWWLYNKTFDCSFIYSKTNGVETHNIREQILNRFGNKIDNVVGRNIKPFDRKIDVLRESRYCIVAQNNQGNNYFTEHIIDCFLTGTIPIFHGCQNIGQFFDAKGIHQFNTLDELEIILNKIGSDDYTQKYTSVIDNFYKATQYYLQEDYIYNNFLRNVLIGEYPC